MKSTKQNILSILMVIGFSLPNTSQAMLFDRGSGLIYDDVLDVTWLQDTNYAQTSGYDADGRMNWSAANTWAAGLSYDGGIYGTINDWRLADVKPVNGSNFQYAYSPAGNTDHGYNINSVQSELAYMFHENLANLSSYDASGAFRSGISGIDWGFANKGLFENGGLYRYWSAVEYEPNTNNAWVFNTFYGHQGFGNKDSEFYAWAVRSGDVTASDMGAVPVPAAFWLMASGLLAMMGLRKNR